MILCLWNMSPILLIFVIGHHMELMNIKSQASLKARLYVKLQGKKIQELSLLGLYHMISACLTIVLTSESSDDMVKTLRILFVFRIFQLIKFKFSVQKSWKCQRTTNKNQFSSLLKWLCF